MKDQIVLEQEKVEEERIKENYYEVTIEDELELVLQKICKVVDMFNKINIQIKVDKVKEEVETIEEKVEKVIVDKEKDIITFAEDNRSSYQLDDEKDLIPISIDDEGIQDYKKVG